MIDSPILAVLLGATLVLGVRQLWRSKSRAGRLLGACAVVVFLLFWPPVGMLLTGIVESPYRESEFPAREAQAIVVVPGVVYSPEVQLPYPIVGADTYESCMYASRLYKHWRQLPILACGGPDPDGGGKRGVPFSVTMREMLMKEGIPGNMIWTEEKSQSTYEHALYGAPLLRSKGVHTIVLVAEAVHMLRADRCFQKQQLEVAAAPCGFHSRSHVRPYLLFPRSESFDWSKKGLHEILGMGWYAMRGRI